MPCPTPNSAESFLIEAVQATQAHLRPLHTARWQILLARGACEVTAKVEEDCLELLVRPLASLNGSSFERVPEPIETMAAWTTRLPGGAKFALTPLNDIALAAEIFLLEPEVAARRVSAALAGIEEGWRAWREGVGPAAGRAAPAGAAPEPASQEVLLRLAHGAGWPAHSRADGAVVLELDTDSRWRQAVWERRADGWWLTVLLSDLAELSPSSRRAIWMALLRLNNFLRGVRGGCVTFGERPAAVLEMGWSEAPAPSELMTACEGLSIACRRCSEALPPLFEEQVASAFLELGMTNQT